MGKVMYNDMAKSPYTGARSPCTGSIVAAREGSRHRYSRRRPTASTDNHLCIPRYSERSPMLTDARSPKP